MPRRFLLHTSLLDVPLCKARPSLVAAGALSASLTQFSLDGCPPLLQAVSGYPDSTVLPVARQLVRVNGGAGVDSPELRKAFLASIPPPECRAYQPAWEVARSIFSSANVSWTSSK